MSTLADFINQPENTFISHNQNCLHCFSVRGNCCCRRRRRRRCCHCCCGLCLLSFVFGLCRGRRINSTIATIVAATTTTATTWSSSVGSNISMSISMSSSISICYSIAIIINSGDGGSSSSSRTCVIRYLVCCFPMCGSIFVNS